MTIAIPGQPLISVLMPVRNAERYVADAIRSIQAQTYPHWELIVIDSSSDRTLPIVQELAAGDQRIRTASTPAGSIGRASNTGVDLARGELVARMDADDIALPERLEAQLDWMRRTDIEVCGAWARWFGDRQDVLWFPRHHRDIAHRLLFGYALLQPTLLTHTSILRRHRYSEQVTFEGFELFTRLVRHHRLGSVPAVLLKSRAHPDEVHIVEGRSCRDDIRASRGPLFRALYPEAGPADLEVVDAVAEGRRLARAGQLERAGEWLSTFADSPDRAHRRWLLARWRKTCLHSGHLGISAYRIYVRHATRFGLPDVLPDLSLGAACALRAPSGSRRYQVLRHLGPRSVRRRVRGLATSKAR